MWKKCNNQNDKNKKKWEHFKGILACCDTAVLTTYIKMQNEGKTNMAITHYYLKGVLKLST